MAGHCEVPPRPDLAVSGGASSAPHRAEGQTNKQPYAHLLARLGGRARVAELKSVSESLSRRLQQRTEELERANGGVKEEPWRQGVIFHHMPLEELLRVGERDVKPHFDALGERLKARFPGADFESPAVKGLKRAETKCRVKYGNDPSQLSDIVRGTLTIDIDSGLEGLYEVVEAILDMDILSSNTQRVTHFDDRFQDPLQGGYMDMLLLLRIRGYVCELQLNFREVVAVKESSDGHGVYENERLRQDNITFAAMTNDFELLKKTLDEGGGQGTRDMYGFMPLNYAAHYGNCQALRLLLDNKADPWAVDKRGQLALHQALLRGHYSASQLLLEELEVPSARAHHAAASLSSALALSLDLLDEDLYEDWAATAQRLSKLATASLGGGQEVWRQWAAEGCAKAWKTARKHHGLAAVLGEPEKDLLNKLLGLAVKADCRPIAEDVVGMGAHFAGLAFEEERPWLRDVLKKDAELCLVSRRHLPALSPHPNLSVGERARIQTLEFERRLRTAVRETKVEEVRALLAAGTAIRQETPEESTLKRPALQYLHHAVKVPEEWTLKQTALHIAARAPANDGATQICAELARRASAVELQQTDSQGCTALHYAAIAGTNLEIFCTMVACCGDQEALVRELGMPGLASMSKTPMELLAARLAALDVFVPNSVVGLTLLELSRLDQWLDQCATHVRSLACIVVSVLGTTSHSLKVKAASTAVELLKTNNPEAVYWLASGSLAFLGFSFVAPHLKTIIDVLRRPPQPNFVIGRKAARMLVRLGVGVLGDLLNLFRQGEARQSNGELRTMGLQRSAELVAEKFVRKSEESSDVLPAQHFPDRVLGPPATVGQHAASWHAALRSLCQQEHASEYIARGWPAEVMSTFAAALVRRLESNGPGTRAAAATDLGRLGSEAVLYAAVLAKLLADSDERFRAEAVSALGMLGREASGSHAAALVQLLKDPSDTVRSATRQSLEAWHIAALDIAASVLQLESAQSTPTEKTAAVRSLGRLSDPELAYVYAPSLAASLADQDEGVRGAAAQTMGTLGPELVGSHAAALIQVLMDPFDAVRNAAQESLKVWFDDVASRLEDVNGRPECTIAAALSIHRLGPKAIRIYADFLTRSLLLYNNGWVVRAEAARALRLIGQAAGQHLAAFVASLVASLEDNSWRVRWRSATALGHLGPAFVEPHAAALSTLLTDVRDDVRLAAVDALGRLYARDLRRLLFHNRTAFLTDAVGTTSKAIEETPREPPAEAPDGSSQVSDKADEADKAFEADEAFETDQADKAFKADEAFEAFEADEAVEEDGEGSTVEAREESSEEAVKFSSQ